MQYFKENPFFSDPVLKKEYRYTPPAGVDDVNKNEWGITGAQAAFRWDSWVEPQVPGRTSTYLSQPLTFFQASQIHWKDDAHNLTKAHPQVLDEDGELSEPGSFFNWFEVAKDPMEVSCIHIQRNPVLPVFIVPANSWVLPLPTKFSRKR